MPTRDPLDELRLLLRPAGGGLHLVSTGRAEQLAMQRALYGVADESAVQAAFECQLHAIADARVIILGVPSDVGAGFRRGANLGRQAIRSALLADDPEWRQAQQQRGVLDIGDVFVVPQLLIDDLVAPDARARIQRAIYPGEADPGDLPVAPLSIAERALDLVLAHNPEARIFIIGGDHSTAFRGGGSRLPVHHLPPLHVEATRTQKTTGVLRDPFLPGHRNTFGQAQCPSTGSKRK